MSLFLNLVYLLFGFSLARSMWMYERFGDEWKNLDVIDIINNNSNNALCMRYYEWWTCNILLYITTMILCRHIYQFFRFGGGDANGSVLNDNSNIASFETESDMVFQFTNGTKPVPPKTSEAPFSEKELNFLVSFVLSELVELVHAHIAWTNPLPNENTSRINTRGRAEARHEVVSQLTMSFLMDCLNGCEKPTLEKFKAPMSSLDLFAMEIDALVDAIYYMQNVCCKRGINLSRFFQVVHQANMAKRWEDGQFHTNELGKVIKPKGWQEPDIVSELLSQIEKFPFIITPELKE